MSDTQNDELKYDNNKRALDLLGDVESGMIRYELARRISQSLDRAEARGRAAGLEEAVEALATVSVSSASNPWNVHEMCFRKLRELKENVPLGTDLTKKEK